MNPSVHIRTKKTTINTKPIFRRIINNCLTNKKMLKY